MEVGAVGAINPIHGVYDDYGYQPISAVGMPESLSPIERIPGLAGGGTTVTEVPGQLGSENGSTELPWFPGQEGTTDPGTGSRLPILNTADGTVTRIPLKTGEDQNASDAAAGIMGADGEDDKDDGKPVENPGEDENKKPGYESSPAECKTCKERKYKDGSDEGNVSFKTASHISPEAAGTAVRAHENEHVQNAYAKAEQNDGKVVSATVTIHTAVCPECGRIYVSGGVTNTRIEYPDESNAYQQSRKAADGTSLRGQNVDARG